ncbi:MAG: VWA domain-containing protein [Lachnospiraceae bacterium]|nr:VWA domain-containing protein [Lachnospiraceae bacterium]
MIIGHNLAAMNANRQYNMVLNRKKKTTEKLSSGYRINRAADDAASLSISEKMRKQIRGLDQGSENMQDGISLCQVMDGALNEIQDELQRLNELSVKASNGTLSASDRADINNEIRQLVAEINRASSSTKFNEINPLSNKDYTPPQGGDADIVFVVDNTGSMGSMINGVVNKMSVFAEDLSEYNVQYGVVEYGDIGDGKRYSEYDLKAYPFTDSADKVSETLSEIASAIGSGKRGSGGDGPESALDGIMTAIDSYDFRAGATKEIILVTDADFHYKGDGSSGSNYTVSDVKNAISDSSARLSVVTGASYKGLYSSFSNGMILNISGDFQKELRGLTKAISEAAGSVPNDPFYNDPVDIQRSSDASNYSQVHTYNVTSQTLGIDDLSCLTTESARAGIDKVSTALKHVSEIRSQIGAEQNGLEHALKANMNTSENTQAAESLLRDADMADEMVALSKENILEQAGQAMMSQANQTPQGVLALLQ